MTTDQKPLYVATSLRSQMLPVDTGTLPTSLWIVVKDAACDEDRKRAYELAYLLTPALYAAVRGQIDALAAAWDRGELPTEKAQVAGDRFKVVREWASAAGWLEPGGPVASVTPAEVASYKLADPPCALTTLLECDAAVLELLERDERQAGAGSDDGDDECGSPDERKLPPSFSISYTKPAKPTGKGAAKAKVSRGKQGGSSAAKLF